jgi:Uma2 family endonuclease
MASMNQVMTKKKGVSRKGEPTWEIAHLFPLQGTWSEDEYLALDTNHLIEFSNGFLEVLPMPTTSHQRLAAFLYGLLLAFASPEDIGMVLFAPLRIRVSSGKFREPDVVFMLREHEERIGEEFWEGADLVIEVVSKGAENRERDLNKKRTDYARGGISEYWIVDPQEERITVLRLHGKEYVVHGEFAKGMTATSHLLPGFAVDVTKAFAAQCPKPQRGKTPSQPRKKPRKKS